MPRILVGVRLRPDSSTDSDTSKNVFNLNESKKSIDFSIAEMNHSFSFDHIFQPQTTQLQIFQNSCIQIIDSVLEGYNGCIFAYGQTGTGKTHTMSGNSSDLWNGIENNKGLAEGHGLVARTSLYLFEKSRSSPESYSFRMSILEIYNETIIDLLNPNSFSENNSAGTFTSAFAAAISSQPTTKLNIIETDGGVQIPNLHILPIDTPEAAIRIFYDTQMNRTVAEHELNRKSSRSHAIYTFYVTKTMDNKSGNKSDPIIHQSKIHLVDLAGSERSNKTKSVGKVQKEANYINKSLSFLEQVVLALGQTSRDHIPYRQSKLTYLLKDSLGGNCHTYMIACIWSKQDHLMETLSTLRFASRMKMIETHPVRNRLVAKESAPSRLLVQELNNLKKELAMRDMLSSISLDNSALWKPAMNDNQLLSVYKDTLNFNLKCPDAEESQSSNNSTSNIPSHVQQAMSEMENSFQIHNLTQIYVMMTLMRTSLWEANDNNEEKVKKSLEKALKKHSPYLSDNTSLKKIFSSFGGEKIDKEQVEDNKIEKSNNLEEEEEEEENNDQKISPEEKERLYKIFSEGEGANLLSSYEEVKNTLKENKLRQKEIITLLNEQKVIIDNASKKIEYIARLKGIEENDDVVFEEEFLKSDISIDQEEEIRSQLDLAKKKYRGAHKELQICKQQLNEIQSLKERAMATFLNAFNDYIESYLKG